jgi:hypothetical protein
MISSNQTNPSTLESYLNVIFFHLLCGDELDSGTFKKPLADGFVQCRIDDDDEHSLILLSGLLKRSFFKRHIGDGLHKKALYTGART